MEAGLVPLLEETVSEFIKNWDYNSSMAVGTCKCFINSNTIAKRNTNQ